MAVAIVPKVITGKSYYRDVDEPNDQIAIQGLVRAATGTASLYADALTTVLTIGGGASNTSTLLRIAGSTKLSLSATQVAVTNADITCVGAGGNSERFGAGALAAGASAVAFGSVASAAVLSSIAIGAGATVTAGATDRSVVIGQGQSFTAVGGGVMIGGAGASIAFTGTVIVGVSATVSGTQSVAIGHSASTDGGGVAVGFQAAATSTGGGSSVAVGVSATATGDYSTALGGNSTATGLSSTAVGQGAATGVRGVSLGRLASGPGDSVAIGFTTVINAAAAGGVAVGRLVGIGAAGIGAVAVGDSASSNVLSSIAIGSTATVTAGATSRSIVIGSAQSFTAAGGGIAIGGAGAAIAFTGVVIVGLGATVGAADGTAVGRSASCGHAGSVALGLSSTTTATSQLHLGAITDIRGTGAMAVTAVSGVLTLAGSTGGVNVTGGLTAASLPVPVVLSKTTGIDLTVVATTNLYTVPTGKTLTILEIVVKPTTATAVTIEPDAGVGIAAGEDDVFASQTLTGLTLTTERFKFPSGGVAVTGAAGEIVKLGVDVGATATALVADVLLIGYLE